MPNETRATRYHRSRLQAGAAAFLVSLLVLLAFGPMGAGPALSRLLHRLVGGWPVGGAVATMIFAFVVLSAEHAARYPFDRYREWTLEGRYGLARLSSGRWARTHLRGMLAHTQFILITHNRRTMEIANRLYGVTMEEPGVSKLISVQLN